MVANTEERLSDLLRDYCEEDPATGCWIWTRCWDRNGYGFVKMGGRVYSVARVAAWLYGAVPLGDPRKLRRSCQTAACFNPEHLLLGGKPVAEA